MQNNNDHFVSKCWVARLLQDAFRVVEKEKSLHIWRKDNAHILYFPWIQKQFHKKGLNWKLSEYKDVKIGGIGGHNCTTLQTENFWNFIPTKEALAMSRNVDFKSTYLSFNNDCIGNILGLEHCNLIHCPESEPGDRSGGKLYANELMKINTNGWKEETYEDTDDSRISFENNLFKLGLG